MENTEKTETTEKNKDNNDMNNGIYEGCGCENPNVFTQTVKDGFNKVFGKMNNLCVAFVAIMTAALIGCATVPTSDQMYKTSHAVGVAAGMVANNIKIDTTVRNNIIAIMNKVEYCVPETNQTFEAAWTKIAEQHVAKLIEEKTIDAKQGELILAAFKVAAKGLDYLFDVRFPEARKYQDLTEAAVHGFVGGFLDMFKPVNVAKLSTGKIEYDKEAYEFLSK